MTLDADLVRRARLLTGNRSATLEGVLPDFVSYERARRQAEEAALNEVIDGLNRFHREHGLLSDKFSAL